MSSGWFRVSHRTRPQTLDRIAPLFPASRESVDSQRPLPIPPATVSRSPPIDRCAEPPSHGGQREGFLLGTPRADPPMSRRRSNPRSEEHTSELQSHSDLVCRLLLEKKNKF